MKILKPTTASASLTIKVPAGLAKRVADAQAAAKARGLTFDIDTPLAKALARLLKQAEADLSLGEEKPPAAQQGLLAAPENSEGLDHVL